MQIKVYTIFPEMFPGPLGVSIVGRALVEEKWSLSPVNLRDFTTDKHRSVDDTAFGGGPGMVMRPDVIDAAFRANVEDRADPLIYLSPRGAPMTQARIKELASCPRLGLLCGRFEGVDQRVIDAWDVEELSLGDFVLSGGELAAMALIDACVRLLPGVLGDAASLEEESFSHGLLEYPQYTRPREWQGHTVPDVLVEGHHAKIRAWRQAEAERLTRARRPDLWQRYCASNIERKD